MKPVLMALMLSLSTAANSEPIETQKIITAITGDWNGDGGTDLAMIVETEPTAPMDMHFFLRDIDHNFLRPVEVVHDQIVGEWNGYDRPGYENSDTEPELTALPNGSIRLHLPAMPIGSERTNQTLTLAYRDGLFIVAGFAFEHEDHLKENAQASCDINLVTGKGQSSKPVTVPGAIIPFAKWNLGIGFAACDAQ